jgi:hydroxyacylglutathione hydrolase
MKRALKLMGLVLLVVLLAIGGMLAWVFIGNGEIPDGREIEGFARIVKDGFVSTAVIDLEDGQLALVDAGNDKEGKALRAELSRRGKGPNDVVAVLITHGHPDHVAALPVFPKAQLFAMEAEAASLAGTDEPRGMLRRFVPARPTGLTVSRLLKDGESFALGQRKARAFWVPGHTRGSAAYLVDGILFLGDSADATSKGTVVGAKWLFSKSVNENAKSLRALANRLKADRSPVKWLVFSHSGVVPGLAALDAAVP